jgi:TRAP-type C4-dicarboxylate transport system permease small subunit
MSNENTGNLLANPLPIVMVVLLAAGVLIKQVPLQSARPSDPERVKFVPAAQQDVEARLWQDPFAAVEKHEGRSGPTTHIPKALRTLIENKSKPDGKVKVIGVSVFGGSYSEAAESRRRTRFAVLSALGFHGYSPANADAIGYFRIKLPGSTKGVTWPDPSSVGLDFNLVGPAGSRMLAELVGGKSEPDSVDLTVPYEWFERRQSSSNERTEPSDVLVLWLNEDKLTTGSLIKLRSLIARLTPAQASSRPKPLNGSKQNVSAPARTNTPKMFVPSATISVCDLAASMPVKNGSSIQKMAGPTWNCFMENPPLLNELTNLPIVRTIGTDDVLAAGLLWELWQRGVNRNLGYKDNWWKRKWDQLVKGQDPATFPRQCADGLVLIREWDSQYGRALSGNLSAGFSARCKVAGDPAPPVRWFTYLRGLDGMLPDIDKSSANAPRKDDSGKSKDLRAQLEDAPPEHAEGRSQYDYLRRLGDEIARLDSDARFAANGVKAIGIVGFDVYDKLLILQALRSRFTDKIFFTTDLDARYLHADQKEWARNLVVASNFDLSLRPALQRSTLPFRDGYQTATYVAALMALEANPPNWTEKMNDWLRPQLFEIGRTEAVHLASPSVPDLKKWIESNYLDGSALPTVHAKCNGSWATCKDIEPERPLRDLPLKHLLAIISMIILGTLSLALVSRHIQQTVYDALNSTKPEEARAAKLWLIGAAALLFTVIATVVGINWAMSASFAQGGEPFVWLEGVSVWPSLVLRFAGLITMIVLVIAFRISMRRQAQLTSERFDLPMPRTWKLARSRWSAVRNGPHLDLASFGPEGKANPKRAGAPVKIASLWQNYLRATGWREMWGWIFTSTAIVFLLGFAPFYFFGMPSFPRRGQLVETLYLILAILNMPFPWLVIFWVGYETRACARFIAILSDVPSVWPTSLLDREEVKTGVPRAHLDDHLDFQLIVLVTRRIHWLIYLPFVFLLFLVLARSSLFDAMDFPLTLIFVTGLALAYAVYTAVLLRRSAEAARAKALAHYDARLLAQARPKDSPPSATADAAAAKPTPISAEQIKLLMERIRSTREGAFAPFTQQPALQALLLPFGGYGGVQLVEYLMNF